MTHPGKEELQKIIEEAVLAGFEISGEGWNGGYGGSNVLGSKPFVRACDEVLAAVPDAWQPISNLLDKPARVGRVIFREGVPVSAVISAAQRLYVAEDLSVASSGGWQPMETAPLDGKHCILAIKRGAFVYSIQGAFMKGKWMNVADDQPEPLAWMPNILLPDEFCPWTEEYKARAALSTDQPAQADTQPAPTPEPVLTDDERARLAMYDFEPVTSGPNPTPSSIVGGIRAQAIEDVLAALTAHELYLYRPKAFDGLIQYARETLIHDALSATATVNDPGSNGETLEKVCRNDPNSDPKNENIGAPSSSSGPTEQQVFAAAAAINPKLFSTNPHEAHMEASPYRVEVEREKVINIARQALIAALAASPQTRCSAGDAANCATATASPLAWLVRDAFYKDKVFLDQQAAQKCAVVREMNSDVLPLGVIALSATAAED